MNLYDIYENIENPILDINIIKEIILLYSDSYHAFGGFYTKLNKAANKKYSGQYYKKDKDIFYSLVFNKWKNSIINMSYDEFKNHLKNGSYGKDLYDLRNYLKTINDVKTSEEAEELIFKKTNNLKIDNALEKYRWNKIGDATGWIHIYSRYLTAKKDNIGDVEHRLYINTESVYTYKLATYFILKCDQYNIPYYFKFDEYGNRDDTFVIYSPNEYLEKYIDILNEIMLEHNDLLENVNTPPILTGKINNWIGYGSEPSKENEKISSYNMKRSLLIENVINKCLKEWIKNNLNKKINFNGEIVTILEYINKKCVIKIMESLKRKYDSMLKNDKKVALNNNTKFDINSVINKVGVNELDFNNNNFKLYLEKYISSNIKSMLKVAFEGDIYKAPSISIPLKNNVKYEFTGSNLYGVFMDISKSISRNDNKFNIDVQNEILNNCSNYGIDSNSFCFDIDKLDYIIKNSK